MDPKQIVAEGYDKIGARYAEEADAVLWEERDRYTSLLPIDSSGSSP